MIHELFLWQNSHPFQGIDDLHGLQQPTSNPYFIGFYTTTRDLNAPLGIISQDRLNLFGYAKDCTISFAKRVYL
jgi:hypothetical protein